MNSASAGCIECTWRRYEAELFYFLLGKLNKRNEAEILLQEIFIRLMKWGMSVAIRRDNFYPALHPF